MNSIIETYDIIADQYYKCREELILQKELDIFMSKIETGGTILDAGCGNGRDIKIFADKGYNCIGVDGSLGQLKIAQGRNYTGNVDFIHSDLRSINLSNKFDGIWCNAVLPHFSNDDIILILNKFKYLLNPNGIIFASFKQGRGEQYVVESEFGNCTRYTNFHQESDIVMFSEIVGLRILKLDFYNERNRFKRYNRDLNFIVVLFAANLKFNYPI